MEFALDKFTLTALLVMPLLSGLAVAIGTRQQAKPMALVSSLFTFVLSLVLAGLFDWSDPGSMQFLYQIPWIPNFGLNVAFGVDSISLWLILLTTFLMPLVVIGSFSAVQDRVREFYAWLLLLQTAMIGTFLATDLLFFYVCFEFTLVPLYFLIGIFGSAERLRAARVFFLYTFTGSALTFASVLYVAWVNASLPQGLHPGSGDWTFNLYVLTAAAQEMSSGQQTLVMLGFLAGFAVKVPLFPFHTWLPLAHTEAPTAGSVILAGVLLKLGTYGLLRLAIPLAPQAAVAFAPWIGALAVAGILYAALICWVQKDIKKLIAYSSVSHLGFCVLGMFAFNAEGLGGSVMYMVNHGLSTGALFLCVGMLYERFHTREIARYGGLAAAMPVWSFFMVFFCLASVGLPGLNGFVGEFLTLFGAFIAGDVLGPTYTLLAGVGMILGAIYILYMVGRVVFGPVKIPSQDHGHGQAAEAPAAHGHDHGHGQAPAVRDLSPREIGVLSPLALACLVLGMYPTPMLKSLEPAVLATAAPALVEVQRAAYRPVQVRLIGTDRVEEHARRARQAAGADGHDHP